MLADTSRYTYSGKPTGCGISLRTTDWRYVYFISAISPISITYQFSSAAALLLARLSLSLVTSRRPLLFCFCCCASGSDGPPLAFDPDPASRCTTTDMTTPPPSSSATVSRHHMITRSRDGTRKPKVFSATHYPVPACFLALQSDASLTCFSQASKVPEWRASMQDEFNALLRAL